jgi:hypothetical protein
VVYHLYTGTEIWCERGFRLALDKGYIFGVELPSRVRFSNAGLHTPTKKNLGGNIQHRGDMQILNIIFFNVKVTLNYLEVGGTQFNSRILLYDIDSDNCHLKKKEIYFQVFVFKNVIQ